MAVMFYANVREVKPVGVEGGGEVWHGEVRGLGGQQAP